MEELLSTPSSHSPWRDYPTGAEPDEPHQPAPLATALILTFCTVMTGLALWKAAELLGAAYAYTLTVTGG